MKKFLVVLVGLMMAVAARAEEVQPTPAPTTWTPTVKSWLSITGNLHLEHRSGVGAENADFYVQYDRMLSPENQIYFGVRGGIYFEKLLHFGSLTTTELQPFIGVHFFKLFNVSDTFAIKAGAVAEAHIGDSSDPVYLWIAGETGFRYTTPNGFFVELPIEIGTFPFFSGIGLFERFGVQVGFEL